MLYFIYLWVIVVFITIVKPNFAADPQCNPIDDLDKYDCFPEYGANEDECIKRGCCWILPSPSSQNTTNSKLSIPYCYYPTNFPNYNVVNSSFNDNEYTYFIQKDKATFRPNEILTLIVKLIFETENRFHVKIYDPNHQRFEVPLVNLNNKKPSHQRIKLEQANYLVNVTNSPFSIKIYRASTGRLIFDTGVAPLIFADQYIQFSTILVNKYFYGIGEHRDSLAHQTDWNSFTLWNRDIYPTPNTNLYGTHPFYLTIENGSSNALGFFLLNSNGMDVNVQPAPSITFITIGGIIDFYVYLGPTAQEVVSQHTDVIGRSFLPPYFSLGFHLCRWNYNNDTNLKEVIRRNRAAGFPYDTQWTDIDGMSNRLDWTYDTDKFSDLPNIVQDLHDHGQYYINIIDPAISNKTGYYPYDSGLIYDIFIKNLNDNQPLVGVVWPGYTVFPDFSNPLTTTWWTNLAYSFHNVIPYDGIWIDMNEPSSFVNGSVLGCPVSQFDNPPYTPRVLDGRLSAKTICASARHNISNHYDLHNLYGYYEAVSTYLALDHIDTVKRPFVLTRSSYAGSGQFAVHWSGDNSATWDDLYYSIPNMLNFNMFGVSMVGSDICGFGGDTTEELCIRWMQLGSFYPFMRNHNDYGSKDQDPASFSLEAQEIIKNALNTRYTLLPYLYTLLYLSNLNGQTVVRPLFFEFTNDTNTHTIDKQFMFGPAFLISPVLEQGATSVLAYFPDDVWYNYKNGQLISSNNSSFIQLETPLSDINVHVRGGYIVPYQQPSVTTKQSRRNPFGILVALKPIDQISAYARGSLFWDDGESKNTVTNNKYNLFDLLADKQSLQIIRLNSGYETNMILEEVKIFGVTNTPTIVTINNQTYDNFIYDDLNQVLSIQYFSFDINQNELTKFSWT